MAVKILHLIVYNVRTLQEELLLLNANVLKITITTEPIANLAILHVKDVLVQTALIVKNALLSSFTNYRPIVAYNVLILVKLVK